VKAKRKLLPMPFPQKRGAMALPPTAAGDFA
jgi:hypothetical protein